MVASGMGPLRWLSSLQARGRTAVQGKRRPGVAAVVALASLLAAACGHPATEAECRVILERIVELELKSQKVNDPAELAKRRGEALGLSSDGGRSDLLEGCIGRHITDRALACVRSAVTASEITENCLQ
jgi:plasmid stability protein